MNSAAPVVLGVIAILLVALMWAPPLRRPEAPKPGTRVRLTVNGAVTWIVGENRNGMVRLRSGGMEMVVSVDELRAFFVRYT